MRTVQLFARRPSIGAGRRLEAEDQHISGREALRVRSEMSQRVKKYLPVLKRIRKMADMAKRAYVKKCDKEFIDCVSECAKNVIKGNVPLSPRQKATLRRDRNNLRSLAIKKTSLKKKRRILQKGGFLSALLPPVLTMLGSLLLKYCKLQRNLF